ncbi:MAG: redoxin family protein, partial [Chryseobacterium sp.]|nr:redoxin family protein [Chryseobacterium sp.]
ANSSADAAGQNDDNSSADAAGQNDANSSADAAGQNDDNSSADAAGQNDESNASATSTETAQTDAADSETSDASSKSADVADDAIVFETIDTEGNTVSSQDIFSQHTLTMVNLWGTFCGPCIREMPDLEILNQRLSEKGCGLIGVFLDVAGPDDTAQIDLAKEIMAGTGVTYMNLLPWETINEDLVAIYIPTTYFIDSNGQIVGEAAVGSRSADDYEALIDELLAGME